MRQQRVDEIKASLNVAVLLMVSFYVLAALSGCAIDISTAMRPVTAAKSHENSFDPKKVRCLWGCGSQEASNEVQGS